MKKSARVFHISILIFLLLMALGCASFQPVPMDQVPFKERARTQSDEDVTVTVAALGPDESKKIFGAGLYSRDIQPVWIEIQNKGQDPYWFFPIRTDPDYYSPGEVAYMKRFRWSRSKNAQMRTHFESMDFRWLIPPGETVSGFVHTNMDPGFKYVNVSVFGPEGMKSFHFVVDVPGIKADYQEVDLKSLYGPEEYVVCDEQRLRAELEKLPCCTTNKNGSRNGDPLNLVFIGDVEDLMAALIGGGWDVTEAMSADSIWRTVRSFLFGRRYRHSPVSSLYVFGRRQEAAFQKARETINERNHIRLWLTPLLFKELPVWIGQISRDIGVKFTLKTGFLTTHVVDSDVDNDRYYLIQNLADAQALTRLGFVKGVGASSPGDPGYNLGGDPYYTDGLRAVLLCTDLPTRFSAIQYFNWEWPPKAKPYANSLIGSRSEPQSGGSEKSRNAGYIHKRVIQPTVIPIGGSFH